MVEIGVVQKVFPKNNTARVTFPRRQECEKCGMCMKHKNEMTVSVLIKNTLDAKVGDKVAVTMKDGFVLRAAFIVYIIPLFGVGLVVGLGRDLNELLLFGLIIAALVVGVGISVLSDRLIRKKGVAVPVMTEITQRMPEPEVRIEVPADNITNSKAAAEVSPESSTADCTNNNTQKLEDSEINKISDNETDFSNDTTNNTLACNSKDTTFDNKK